ncbi:MAG: hypothetical protein WC631_03210 [Candidatus Paceibacterota bacterium]|jgi:hypothetical protein
MSAKNWSWGIAEAVIWYIAVYYFLFVIKNEVNLYWSALILLVLSYAGMIACPWFRNTNAWKELRRKDQI